MLFSILKIIAVSVCSLMAGFSTLHTLQIEKYRIPALRRKLAKRGNSVIKLEYIIAIVAVLAYVGLPVPLLLAGVLNEGVRNILTDVIVLAAFISATVIVFMKRRKIPQSREFVLTHRTIRLIAVILLMNLIGATVLFMLDISPYIMFAASEHVIVISAIAMNPVEERLNKRYYAAAGRKLRERKKLIRIGITGSRGKTTVKVILKEMLSTKYSVLATPPSFASEMGIARTINERLTDQHQIFIAEMGAQQKGDVRSMARMVAPQIGILTCIGTDHMDSLGSVESIAQAKYELIQNLPEKGKAFFGSDGGFGDRLYHMCRKTKYRSAIGTEVESDMHAENIEYGVKGTRFDLVNSNGERIGINTKLLGSSNVLDIVLAASVAAQLGIGLAEISEAAAKVKPMQGHMQLFTEEINLIDDSENLTPEGAVEAVEVLSVFPGRRILVTAGFSDPGENNEDKNFAFGVQIAGKADYVILIDPTHTAPIMRGLMTEHFAKSSVRMVSSEADAAEILREIAKDGDTVLYEGVYAE